MPFVREGKIFQDPCVKCPDAVFCRLDYWKKKDRDQCDYLEIDFDWYEKKLQPIGKLNGAFIIREETDDRGNIYVVCNLEGTHYVGFKNYGVNYYSLRKCLFDIDVEYVNELESVDFKTALVSILTWHEGFKCSNSDGGMPSFKDYMNYTMLKNALMNGRGTRRRRSTSNRSEFVSTAHDGPQGLDNFR